MKEAGYQLTLGAEEKLYTFMNEFCQPGQPGYGDARIVRQIFEHLKGNLATRVIENQVRDQRELNLIAAEDVPDAPIRLEMQRVRVSR